MKSIYDNLLLVGSPISISDLVIQTPAGLNIKFNLITVQLSDKVDLTWVDLQAALLTYESKLEQLSALNTSFQHQANIANNAGKTINIKLMAQATIITGEINLRKIEEEERLEAVAGMEETVTIAQSAKSVENLGILQHIVISDMTRFIWGPHHLLQTPATQMLPM